MDSRSYYPNYFTIEDILATNERLPCKVLDEIPGLGRLLYCTDFNKYLKYFLTITCLLFNKTNVCKDYTNLVYSNGKLIL